MRKDEWSSRMQIKSHALTNLLFLLIGCAGLTAQAQPRFSLNSAGDEVTDSQTKLTWKRCTEGMTWNGTTCINTPKNFTQEEAVKLFKTPVAGRPAWRLPTIDELFKLADQTKKNPAIDTAVFPQTQSALYWALPYAGKTTQPWGVDFSSGFIGDGYKSYNSFVRLVR